jgi:uncharacterized glyoxalase superfamily protein PhnB
MPAVGFISPALYYRDADAAIRFLTRAFGFACRVSVPDESGGIAHAELTWRDSVIMLATARPAQQLFSPLDLSGVHQSLSVIVDDVEVHHARAVAAGATVVKALREESYGGRGYDVRDPEGHLWYFGTYVPGAWWDAPATGG